MDQRIKFLQSGLSGPDAILGFGRPAALSFAACYPKLGRFDNTLLGCAQGEHFNSTILAAPALSPPFHSGKAGPGERFVAADLYHQYSLGLLLRRYQPIGNNSGHHAIPFAARLVFGNLHLGGLGPAFQPAQQGAWCSSPDLLLSWGDHSGLLPRLFPFVFRRQPQPLTSFAY